jgi:glycerol-3-phosphate acyltransferase PlsY
LAWKAVLWIVASYFIGSIPFGLLLARALFKQDLRKMGSGNIGATNVLRNFGAPAFIAVTTLDLGKGVVSVLVGRLLGLNASLVLIAGLATIIGHNWSIYLKFKGGKGIATSGGVIVAAYPWQVSLAVVGIFLVVVLITRVMSLGSIAAAFAFPVSTVIFLASEYSDKWYYWTYTIVAVLGCVFAIYKHRDNIKRIIRGDEPKIGKGQKRAKGIEA